MIIQMLKTFNDSPNAGLSVYTKYYARLINYLITAITATYSEGSIVSPSTGCGSSEIKTAEYRLTFLIVGPSCPASIVKTNSPNGVTLDANSVRITTLPAAGHSDPVSYTHLTLPTIYSV